MKFVEAYNMIDLFMTGVLLIGLIFGLWKGFLRSLTALAGLVIGVIAAARYHSWVGPYLNKVSSLDPQIAAILSMLIIFIVVQVIFVLIRRLLDALIDLTRLGWLDRTFGGMMGLFASFLLVAAGVQALLIAMPEWPLVKSSKLVKPVSGLTAKLMTYAPKQARDQVQSFTAKWKGMQESSSQKNAGQTPRPKQAPTAPPGLAK